MRDILRGIPVFLEDQLPGLVVGLVFGAGVLLAILFSTGSLDDADCSAEVEAAELAMVEQILGEVMESVVLPAVVQIQALQAQLSLAQAQNGPGGDSGIRQNEELGAWSDAAGEFACFPVEGAGFD